MHDHEKNKSCDKKMWLMMLPCLLVPIVFLVIAGKGIKSLTGNWQLMATFAFMFLIHALMMKFMHSNSEEEAKDKE